MFFTGYHSVELLVNLPVAGINTAITNHFKMLFRDMSDKVLDEFHDRERFLHIGIIFVTVVMESDRIPIVLINPRSRNDWSPKVTSDVVYGGLGVAFVGLGIHIEAFLVFLVAAGLYFFKGRTDLRFHFIQQSSAEGITEVSVIEVVDLAPESIVTIAAF